MNRRNFLVHCGLAGAGAFCLPALAPASGLLEDAAPPSAAADETLVRHLSAYGSDVGSWTPAAFAQATGLAPGSGAVHLRARVEDLARLTRFFASRSFAELGPVHAINNTLSFRFRGTSYTVTNELRS